MRTVLAFVLLATLLLAACDTAAPGAADGAVSTADAAGPAADAADPAGDTAPPPAPDADGDDTVAGDAPAGVDTPGGATCESPAVEDCDGVDNDCDGQTDEDLERAYYDGPEGTQGVGACRAGTEACWDGAWQRLPGQTTPLDEVCDSSDNDCDGATDEGVCDPGALTIAMSAPETECFEWEGVGGDIEVMLRWTTSIPAICELAESRNEGSAWRFGFGEHTPKTDHEFLDRLAGYDFWDGPPQVGDRISWVAVCAPGEDALPALSAPAEVVLDATMVDCIWPFDRACGDDSGILCRVALRGCEGGRVPAIIAGCGRCVFPETCTCDDGLPVDCALEPPDCGGRVLATQGGCYVCVDPWTCAE